MAAVLCRPVSSAALSSAAAAAAAWGNLTGTLLRRRSAAACTRASTPGSSSQERGLGRGRPCRGMTSSTSASTSASSSPPQSAVPAPAAARDSQTCRLPDGRTLGFAEYGAADGQPVLYFHGFPSSRLEGTAADKAARRHKVRLLCLDRPGYGLSTAQPGRRMVDWADDVLAFSAALRLTRFGIMGASGGGPYTLACASRLPGRMLTHVGVMCGAGPWDSTTIKHIPRLSRVTAFLARRWPWGLQMLIAGLAGSLQWLARTRLVSSWVDRWLGDMQKRAENAGNAELAAATANGNGNAQLPIPQQREEIYRSLFDTFSQGSQHIVQEALLLCSDFGFKPEDVTFDPVVFWHGDRDANAPLDWSKPMIDRIPHAVLKVYPGRTHVSLAEDIDEIMAHFAPSNETAKDTPAKQRPLAPPCLDRLSVLL